MMNFSVFFFNGVANGNENILCLVSPVLIMEVVRGGDTGERLLPEQLARWVRIAHAADILFTHHDG